MKKYVKYDNIEYFMPFLFCNDIFIPFINKLLKEEHDPIKYVYGSVYCLWTSGRITNCFINNVVHIENYLERLKKYNYVPLFIFNSINETKEVLNDEFSNNLLDIAIKCNSEFVVASEVLYNHIKSIYPNAKMHCSVISAINNFINDKNFDETTFYNKMLDKYDTVVIRPEYTLDNIDKLDKLIPEISRIEILPNQYCAYNCPNHIKHYQLQEMELSYEYKYNNKQVQIEKVISKLNDFCKKQCPKQSKTKYRNVSFSNQQVEQLIQLGVKKIKLQGRDYSFELLFNELYNYFFNNDIPFETIKSIKDNMLSNMVEQNKQAQLNFV